MICGACGRDLNHNNIPAELRHEVLLRYCGGCSNSLRRFIENRGGITIERGSTYNFLYKRIIDDEKMRCLELDWLAANIIKLAKRVQNHQTIDKCERLSVNGVTCEHFAKTIFEGRRVCGSCLHAIKKRRKDGIEEPFCHSSSNSSWLKEICTQIEKRLGQKIYADFDFQKKT